MLAWRVEVIAAQSKAGIKIDKKGEYCFCQNKRCQKKVKLHKPVIPEGYFQDCDKDDLLKWFKEKKGALARDYINTQKSKRKER